MNTYPYAVCEEGIAVKHSSNNVLVSEQTEEAIGFTMIFIYLFFDA